MIAIWPSLAALSAVSQASVSDLLPYLVVLVAGFMVGAWGQSSRSAIGTIAGILLILAAIIGFLVEFPMCPEGTRCLE